MDRYTCASNAWVPRPCWRASSLWWSARKRSVRSWHARGNVPPAASLRVLLALTALTGAVWSVVDPSRAFSAALAVLVVSCPCAFALAVPAAITRALAVLARCGVLVVKPDAIQALAEATHVMFDKTGTLTEPELALGGREDFRWRVA